MTTLYESFNDSFTLLPVRVYRHDLYGANISAPLHWHRSLELTVPLSGKLHFNVGRNNLGGGEADWFIGNSGELHSCSAVEGCAHFTGVSLLLSLPFMEKWVGRGLEFYNPELAPVTEEIRRLSKLIYELDENAPDYRFALMSLVFEVLGLLSRFCSRKSEQDAGSMVRNQALASELTEYIEQHYRENLSLNDIAAVFKYSPSYFSRLFKELLGVNFHAYLLYVRVLHSAEELLSGADTLTECAFRNGFSNVKSFISVFKKTFGQTPSAYVEAHRGAAADPRPANEKDGES